MDGDMMAIIIAILAGICSVAWLCFKVIDSWIAAEAGRPPVLRLKRLGHTLPSTVRGVICPQCSHKFDVPVTIE